MRGDVVRFIRRKKRCGTKQKTGVASEKKTRKEYEGGLGGCLMRGNCPKQVLNRKKGEESEGKGKKRKEIGREREGRRGETILSKREPGSEKGGRGGGKGGGGKGLREESRRAKTPRKKKKGSNRIGKRKNKKRRSDGTIEWKKGREGVQEKRKLLSGKKKDKRKNKIWLHQKKRGDKREWGKKK